MRENPQTVADLVKRIRMSDADEFSVLKRTLAADTRVSVKRALEVAERRLESEAAEQERLNGLYRFEHELTGGALAMGLDEVGRGPLAGPLTVAAVVLRPSYVIAGLNDSKQVAPADRVRIVEEIRAQAHAVSVVHISPSEIDAKGMTKCLRQAFSQAIAEIDKQISGCTVVLIDGNPIHVDSREISIVKGDAQCASIAAASLVAKVARDSLMDDFARQYPGYGFESNKGYGTVDHRQALVNLGPSPIHRMTFCSGLLQPSLFDGIDE